MSIKFIVTDGHVEKKASGAEIPVKTGIWTDDSRYTGPVLREIRKTHR